VVVSHDLESLAKMCDTGVWLHQGRVRMTGDMRMVIEAYKKCWSQLSEQRGADTASAASLEGEVALTAGFPPLVA
jgi:ABC-type glutathione transport system ATPase component